MPDLPPQLDIEKALNFPISGVILKVAFSLIGFFHILNGDLTGLAIQLQQTTNANIKKPVAKQTR